MGQNGLLYLQNRPAKLAAGIVEAARSLGGQLFGSESVPNQRVA